MQCVHCHSETVVKNGIRRLQDGQVVQYYRCRDCHRTFDERRGTPMARLRTPSTVVEFALKNRSEGNVTPAMAMGFISRPVTMHELLNSRGFEALPP